MDIRPRPNLEPRWTPISFLKLVECYVFRKRITQQFKDELTRLDPKKLLNRQDGVKLLETLFKKSNDMTTIYGSAEKLMHNLFLVQQIPKNSDFLGIQNSLNYHSIPTRYINYQKFEYMEKTDVFLSFIDFYNFTVVPKVHQSFVALIMKSVGNGIGRDMKESFEFVDDELFSRSVFPKVTGYRNVMHRYLLVKESYDECADGDSDNDTTHEILSVFADYIDEDLSSESMLLFREVLEHKFELKEKTVEEVYEKFAQLYDQENDQELLEDLKTELEVTNKVHPIARNVSRYADIFKEQLIWKNSLKIFFGSSSPPNDFRKKYLIVRGFEDDDIGKGKLFFFAKDLENVLDIAMMSEHAKPFPKGLFPVETEEDRKMGILRTVELDTFLNVLKILDLDEGEFELVNIPHATTNRGDVIPANSPYGTYCKLARHAFCDFLEQLTVGMNLFQAVSKENLPKIYEWLEQFFEEDGVFSVSRNYRYFVESWKLDEIIDRAYQELEQYITEPVYKFAHKKYTYTKAEALEELRKFAPNFGNQQKLANSYKLYVSTESRPLTAEVIQVLYECGIRNSVIDNMPKCISFLGNQGIRRQLQINAQNGGSINGNYSDYSKKYRESIMKILPKISDKYDTPREQFDTMIKAEMKDYSNCIWIVKEENRLDHLLISKTILENFENKYSNGQWYLRRRVTPIAIPDKFMEMWASDNKLFDLMTQAGNKLNDGVERSRNEIFELKNAILDNFQENLQEEDEATQKSFVQLFKSLYLSSGK